MSSNTLNLSGNANQIAETIIPAGEGHAQDWHRWARQALAAVVKHCQSKNLAANEVPRILAHADAAELRDIFDGTPAQPLAAEGNEKALASIRAIAAQHVADFR